MVRTGLNITELQNLEVMINHLVVITGLNITKLQNLEVMINHLVVVIIIPSLFGSYLHDGCSDAFRSSYIMVITFKLKYSSFVK